MTRTVTADVQGRTISVWDERFEAGPRQCAYQTSVPEEWTVRDILKRFGIGEHLCVYETSDNGRCLQNGDRWSDDV